MPADAVTNNQGGPGKFFDLGNLQVLKGSQGTLFGRNTTGGALVLEPNMPRPEFSASMRAGTSNYNGQSYEAVINQQIGRAHVRTPVTNAQLICRLLLEKTKNKKKKHLYN